LEDTRLRLERLQPVAEQIAKDELDTARVNASNAEARLKAAIAQVAQAQTRVSILTTALAETELRAPFAGRVAARYVGPGAAVTAGTPVLRLTQLDDLILRFGVPEPIARSLKPGLPVAFQAEGLPGELTGRIESLSPEVDTASLLVIVEATAEVPAELEGKLPSGVTGRVTLQTPLLGQHR
jgi:RND family efflux transporter MFP subunit